MLLIIFNNDIKKNMVNGLHLYLTFPVFVTTIPALEKHKSQLPIHTIIYRGRPYNTRFWPANQGQLTLTLTYTHMANLVHHGSVLTRKRLTCWTAELLLNHLGAINTLSALHSVWQSCQSAGSKDHLRQDWYSSFTCSLQAPSLHLRVCLCPYIPLL